MPATKRMVLKPMVCQATMTAMAASAVSLVESQRGWGATRLVPSSELNESTPDKMP